MPITEAEMPMEEMARRVESREWVCAQCGGKLGVTWGGYFGYTSTHILRCFTDPKHNGIGRLPPEPKNWNFQAKEEFMTQDHGKVTALALRKYNAVTVLDRKAAKEMLLILFPGAEKASPAEFEKALSLCADYGLDPRTNDLHMLPFKVKVKDERGQDTGKEKTVYQTVRGISTSRKIARRKHNYVFMENTPRYMTEDEEKRVYKTVDPEYIRYIVKLRDVDTRAESVGYGVWAKHRYWYDKQGGKHQEPHVPKGIDRGNTPENMARIHAERQAIDALYPMDMPDATIPVAETSVDAKWRVIPDDGGKLVDASTLSSTEIPYEGDGAERSVDEATDESTGVNQGTDSPPPATDLAAQAEATVAAEAPPPPPPPTAQAQAKAGKSDDPSPPPAEVPAFKNWGDFCTVTTGYSVLGSAVLKRGNFKKWEDTNFRDAWALFLEIWTERKNAQRLPGV